jgi:hypothetical protein
LEDDFWGKMRNLDIVDFSKASKRAWELEDALWSAKTRKVILDQRAGDTTQLDIAIEMLECELKAELVLRHQNRRPKPCA